MARGEASCEVSREASEIPRGLAGAAATSASADEAADVLRSASHPMPAAIIREAQRRKSRFSSDVGRQRLIPGRPRYRVGWFSTPHSYRADEDDHSSALHSPSVRRVTNTPTGQGSAKQHRPQPLQGAPTSGFSGASGWIQTTRDGMRGLYARCEGGGWALPISSRSSVAFGSSPLTSGKGQRPASCIDRGVRERGGWCAEVERLDRRACPSATPNRCIIAWSSGASAPRHLGV